MIPYAIIYWVIPFDDPKGTLGPQYEALMKEIANATSLKECAITFGPFSSFESAEQVLDWFANL